MKNMRPLAQIERYLVGVVFFIPLACLAVVVPAMFIAPDSLFIFGAFICLACPFLFGVGGYAANRIAGQQKRMGLPVLAAAASYAVAVVPWTLVVGVMDGVIGPCNTHDPTPTGIFIWLALPSLGAGGALWAMTRSWLVGLVPVVASIGAFGAAYFSRTLFGSRNAEAFLLGETWIVVVLVAMFAWAFIERRRPPASDGMCKGCGYDLSGNVSGVCPECGEPVSAASRFHPHSGQPEEKSPSRS